MSPVGALELPFRIQHPASQNTINDKQGKSQNIHLSPDGAPELPLCIPHQPQLIIALAQAGLPPPVLWTIHGVDVLHMETYVRIEYISPAAQKQQLV